MKLNDERRWLLRRWSYTCGWSINTMTAKKWQAHVAALVKGGLLEQSGEGKTAMYRVTEAGRAALPLPHGEGSKIKPAVERREA